MLGFVYTIVYKQLTVSVFYDSRCFLIWFSKRDLNVGSKRLRDHLLYMLWTL